MIESSLRGNIVYNEKIDAGVWPVKVDLAEFELAIVNIAVNARDAMPNGGTFTLTAGNVETDEALRDDEQIEDYVAIAVLRHRHGHSAESLVEDLRSVLHHQGSRQGHRARPVAGLWLRPSGRRHGARPTARSDEGTTITVYLPSVQRRGHRRPKDMPRSTRRVRSARWCSSSTTAPKSRK